VRGSDEMARSPSVTERSERDVVSAPPTEADRMTSDDGFIRPPSAGVTGFGSGSRDTDRAITDCPPTGDEVMATSARTARSVPVASAGSERATAVALGSPEGAWSVDVVPNDVVSGCVRSNVEVSPAALAGDSVASRPDAIARRAITCEMLGESGADTRATVFPPLLDTAPCDIGAEVGAFVVAVPAWGSDAEPVRAWRRARKLAAACSPPPVMGPVTEAAAADDRAIECDVTDAVRPVPTAPDPDAFRDPLL